MCEYNRQAGTKRKQNTRKKETTEATEAEAEAKPPQGAWSGMSLTSADRIRMFLWTDKLHSAHIYLFPEQKYLFYANLNPMCSLSNLNIYSIVKTFNEAGEGGG